jgi:hypothetical protein
MEAVPRNVIAHPLFAAQFDGTDRVVACLVAGLTVLVFLHAGIDRALAISLAASLRNIGLVMATLGPTLPDLAWFYFALAQFPIYLFPYLLKPVARRLVVQRQRGRGGTW